MLRVQVTTYRDHIVINTVLMRRDKFFLLTQRPRCLLLDTGRHLGLSGPALRWLRAVPRGHDVFGDVTAYRQHDVGVFGWLGGPHVYRGPGIEGSVVYDVDAISYVEIPNATPHEARVAVNSDINSGVG